jgi:hypothetical protein
LILFLPFFVGAGFSMNDAGTYTEIIPPGWVSTFVQHISNQDEIADIGKAVIQHRQQFSTIAMEFTRNLSCPDWARKEAHGINDDKAKWFAVKRLF